MGQYDYYNYILKIKIKDNLTDLRLVDFIKNWNFTCNEFVNFQKSIEPIYNYTSERIIQFFLTYEKYDICPDFYNRFEPVNKSFNSDDISDLIHCLSFPSGILHLKKKKAFRVEIDNLWYGLIFDSTKERHVIQSKRKIGEYLGEITFFFSKSKKWSLDIYKTIIDDFCLYLETDFGVIIDQESGKQLYSFDRRD